MVDNDSPVGAMCRVNGVASRIAGGIRKVCDRWFRVRIGNRMNRKTGRMPPPPPAEPSAGWSALLPAWPVWLFRRVSWPSFPRLRAWRRGPPRFRRIPLQFFQLHVDILEQRGGRETLLQLLECLDGFLGLAQGNQGLPPQILQMVGRGPEALAVRYWSSRTRAWSHWPEVLSRLASTNRRRAAVALAPPARN